MLYNIIEIYDTIRVFFILLHSISLYHAYICQLYSEKIPYTGSHTIFLLGSIYAKFRVTYGPKMFHMLLVWVCDLSALLCILLILCVIYSLYIFYGRQSRYSHTDRFLCGQEAAV